MLILSRKENESIMIGDKIEVTIVDVRGDQVKIGIKAPKNVKVYRREVYESIQRENMAAVLANPDSIPSTLPELGGLFGKAADGKAVDTKTPDNPIDKKE